MPDRLQYRKKKHWHALNFLCFILPILAGLVLIGACGNDDDAKPPINGPASGKDTLKSINSNIPDYNSPDNAFLFIQKIELPEEETLAIFSQVIQNIWNQKLIDIYLQKIPITAEDIQKGLQYRYYLSPRIDRATNSVQHMKTARLYMFYLMISGENLLRKGEHLAGFDRLSAAQVLAGMLAEYPSCSMELLMSYANLQSLSEFLLHLKKSDLLSNNDLLQLFDSRKFVYRMPVSLYAALSGDKQAILTAIIDVQNDFLSEKQLSRMLGEHYPDLYLDMKRVNHVYVDTVLNAELTRLLRACTQGKSYEADLSVYPFLNLADENVLQFFLTPYSHLFPQIQKIFHQLLILSASEPAAPNSPQNELKNDVQQNP